MSMSRITSKHRFAAGLVSLSLASCAGVCAAAPQETPAQPAPSNPVTVLPPLTRDMPSSKTVVHTKDEIITTVITQGDHSTSRTITHVYLKHKMLKISATDTAIWPVPEPYKITPIPGSEVITTHPDGTRTMTRKYIQTGSPPWTDPDPTVTLPDGTRLHTPSEAPVEPAIPAPDAPPVTTVVKSEDEVTTTTTLRKGNTTATTITTVGPKHPPYTTTLSSIASSLPPYSTEVTPVPGTKTVTVHPDGTVTTTQMYRQFSAPVGGATMASVASPARVTTTTKTVTETPDATTTTTSSKITVNGKKATTSTTFVAPKSTTIIITNPDGTATTKSLPIHQANLVPPSNGRDVPPTFTAKP